MLAAAALATRPDVFPYVPGSGPEWPWGTWACAASVFLSTGRARRAKSAGAALAWCALGGPALALAIVAVKTTVFSVELARTVPVALGGEGFPLVDELWSTTVRRSAALFALGTAHGLVFARIHQLRGIGAIEWTDRVRRVAGTWALAAGIAGIVHAVVVEHWLGVEMLSEEGTFVGHGNWGTFRVTSLGVGVVLAAWGAATTVPAVRRVAARRAWLDRVRSGREPGWSVRSAATDAERALPLVFVDSPGEEVVCEGAADSSAYREASVARARV